jgi:hypothetical protein
MTGFRDAVEIDHITFVYLDRSAFAREVSRFTNSVPTYRIDQARLVAQRKSDNRSA